MAISEQDIKKLWGLSAGRCAYPGCNVDCIQFFNADDPTILGEMAHVIAKKPKGTRGKPGGGPDTYENLILLCPSHHRAIDKAPKGTFPEELLLRWKRDHEASIRRLFVSTVYGNKVALCSAILLLLAENRQVWTTYGPESEEAKLNPLSSSARVWGLRKLSRIVPNNRKIINLIEVNKGLFSAEEYVACCRFVEHSEGFEASCYSRREGVPRFPADFQEVIEKNARSK